MGISINTDTIKDKSLSVAKDGGATIVSVGAGVVTYGIANELFGVKISNKIAENIAKNAQLHNKLFKDSAIKAFKNENIFCTTVDRALNTFLDTPINDDFSNNECKAFTAYMSKDKDIASKINNKIDDYTGKIISKLNIIKKEGCLSEQTEKGLNAMSKKGFVFCDLEKISMATFHEMGHVKNFRSKGLGKLLQGLKHPLVKKITITTALLGVILPPTKKEDEQNSSVLGKAGKVLKDNCVAISGLATVPTVLEEGLASIKGAQIAKKVLSPDKLKIVNKMNGKAFLTYLIGATLLPLGVYVAKKTRNAFS